MRVQKAKLLIVVMAACVGVAVAGRLGWFAMVGKKTILAPEAGRTPTEAVPQWFNGPRAEIWKQSNQSAPASRTKMEAYATLANANVSGSEPPKREEKVEAAPVSTGPEPYAHFPEVSIACLILGDSDHRQDDRVLLLFDIKQPRQHLGDKGKLPFGYFREGEVLTAFPEIKIESIDAIKNLVVFRMPKHRDAKGRYEAYKGDDTDSVLVERTIVAPSIDSKLLSQQDAETLDAAQRSDAEKRSAAIMRLQALDRDAPRKTEETYPGSNVWALGSEDMSMVAEDYDERLRQDVTVSSYNKNGVVGVQIQRIDDRSVFASRGLMQNDVVVAVNEHSIPTMSEFVRYVRKNPERNFYEVKVLRNGRERVLTYHVPR